ncbi:hypothetical protein A7J05_34820 [Streptomyces alfalfae]|uniref:Uncharacterized protein n=1 Tax=Streptomyces alfalfae TaxID=1642299 RepID=A0ABM6H1Y8_9ACTN|nr:hypothetical protein A7J05_34820 [Streptomyces alfalfae]
MSYVVASQPPRKAPTGAAHMASMREVEATRPMRRAGTIACRREGPSTIVAPIPAPQTASDSPAAYGFGAAARPRMASPSTAAVQVSAVPMPSRRPRLEAMPAPSRPPTASAVRSGPKP